MKINQRKEVISQIKDLATGKKVVGVGAGNSNSIAFSNDPVTDVTGVGQDRVIEWDAISYIEFIDGMPTMNEFVNIDNMISPSIAHTTVTTLNGLNYLACSSGLNTKFTIVASPRENISYRATFSGYCRAVLYINGNPVMYHADDATSGEQVVSTSSPIALARNTEYEISLITYGHLESPPSLSVNLESELFRFLEYVTAPDVPSPSNVTATTDLVDGVLLRWELPPGTQLPGGGVEIIAIPADTSGATGSIIGRAPFPATSFVHSIRSESSSLLNNSAFQSLQGTSYSIPESEYDDLTGITDWGVTMEPWCSVTSVTNPLTSDYSAYLRIKAELASTVIFNSISSYSLNGNGTEVNYPAHDPEAGVILPYTATNSIYVTPGISSSAGNGEVDVVVKWSPPGIGSTANVAIAILRGATTVVSGVHNIESGIYTYTLTGADATYWHADPTDFTVGVVTSAALLNGASAGTSYVNLTTVYAIEDMTHDEYTPIVTLSSAPIVLSGIGSLQYDMLASSAAQGRPSVFVSVYDSGMNIIDTMYSSAETYKNSASQSGSSWARYKGSVYLTQECMDNGVYARCGLALFGSNSDVEQLLFNLQFLRILAPSGQTLGSGSRYAYYVRCYTSTMNYSDTVGPVYGEIPSTAHSIRIEPESDYISLFKKSSLLITSNTPLSGLTVHAKNAEESLSVPYAIESSSSNSSSFVCSLSPLLSGAFVFDTFVHDFSEANIQVGDQYTVGSAFTSSEDSPNRVPAVYTVPTPATVSIGSPSSGGIWLGELSGDWNTNLYFSSATVGTYKEYLTGNSTSSFGDSVFYNNGETLSVGMIVVFTSLPVFNGTGESNVVLCNKQRTFNLAYDSYNHRITLQVRKTGAGAAVWSTRVRSAFTPSLNVPYFIHASIDISSTGDSERTYICATNMSTGNTDSGLTTVEEIIPSASTIDWLTATNTRAGVLNSTSGINPGWSFYINTMYLTTRVMERTVLTEHVIPHVLTRNPLFPLFGFESLEEINITAEGTPQTSIDPNTQNGAIPLGADQVVADATIFVDNEMPDGTIYILRDTYTLRQEDIDSMSESQPLYTYSRINKVLVDFTPTGYAGIDEVRFSNDRTSWGPYIQYNRQVLYPWAIAELTGEDDTVSGAIRYVWAQARTSSGISTDPFLQETHHDSILYNPLAAIGGIESYNYLKGVSGWAVDLSGTAEFSDTIIRKNCIVLGRNVDQLQLASSPLGLQIDGEYNVVPFSAFDSTVHPSALVVAAYDTSDDMLRYSSNIVSDIVNGDHIYIPALLDITAVGLGNIHSIFDYTISNGTSTYYLLGANPDGVDSWLPTCNIVNRSLYTTNGIYLDKYASFVPDVGDLEKEYQSVVSDSQIISHKVCYSESGELRHYLLTKTVDEEQYFIHILGEGDSSDTTFDLIQLIALIVNMSLLGENSLAVNGDRLAFATGLGLVATLQLDRYGRVGTGASSYNMSEIMLFPTTIIYDFASYTTATALTKQAGLPPNGGLVVRYPTGVSFIGRNIIMYTEPGVNPNTDQQYNNQVVDDDGYRLYNVLSIGVPDRQTPASPIGRFSYFAFISNRVIDVDTTTWSSPSPGYSSEVIAPPFYVLDDPGMPASSIASNTNQLFTNYSEALRRKDPFITANVLADGTAEAERAMGFRKPIFVNKQVYIPYTTSLQGATPYNSACVFVFSHNGKSLSVVPNVITGYSNRKLLSAIYDGNYLIELKANDTHLTLDIAQM